MSKAVFIVGLILSTAVHVWLLTVPSDVSLREIRPPIVVPVVETELADPHREDTAAAEPDPEPEPVEPEPEPVEEVPPPSPPLVKVAEAPETEVQAPGDFAGEQDGHTVPELRINWGTDEQALATLEAGGMLMAVLDASAPTPLIKQQIVRGDDGWHRRPYQPAGTTLFSNRLRIVDHVPAFGEVRDGADVGGNERLAVVVPLRVERVLESAQMEAAFSRGLVMAQIDSFAGRFTLHDGRLAFDVTHVGQIARSASP